MNRFTVEETNLISIYIADTRRFYQSTDSLQITVESTGEFYGINNTIL